MRIKTIFIFFLFITLVLGAGCKKQVSNEVLVQTDALPEIDGMIGESEYRVTIETEKMILYLSRNSEELVFGLAGQTLGWVAIGFGSLSMDKSHIIIGYSTGDSMVIGEQDGIGHGHLDTDERILLDAIIKEKDGNTIFEGSVNAQELIQPGQKEVFIIIACGSGDDFTSRHIFRKSLIVRLTEK